MEQFFHVLAFLMALQKQQKLEHVFSSCILAILLPTESLTLEEVQKRVQGQFQIRLSRATISGLCHLLQKEKSIAWRAVSTEITLLAKGRERQQQINNEMEASTDRIMLFLEELKSAVHFRGDTEILATKLQNILCTHLPISFGVKSEEKRTMSESPLDDLEERILRFFLQIRTSTPQVYTTLKEIAAATVFFDLMATQGKLPWEKEPFQKTIVYLDANMLFSLLGLHEEVINIPACELIRLLKAQSAFTLKVSEYTVAEMRRVLQGYAAEYGKYLPEFEVSSIYYELKRRGITPEKVEQEILPHLAEKIETELGIEIEYLPGELLSAPLETSKIVALKERKRSSKLKVYRKYSQNEAELDLSARHDIFLISRIRALREQRQFQKLEHVRAFLLTADGILSFFNFREWHHAERGSLPEVIHYGFLMNAMWLRNPTWDSELPLFGILVEAYQRVRIDVKVWENFMAELQQLAINGEYNEEKMNMLLSSTVLEKSLRRATAAQITPDFFVKMYRLAQAEKNRTIKKLTTDIRIKLEQEGFDKQIVHLESRHEIRLKSFAHRLTLFFIHVTALLGVIGISYAIYFATNFLQHHWKFFEADISLISFWIVTTGSCIHFAFGFKFHPLKMRQKIYDILFSKFYRWALKHFAL